MTPDRPTLRYRHQSHRERRGYFLVAAAYSVLLLIVAVYQLSHGQPFGDVAPVLVLRVVVVGLILLLVVKYRDSAGVADAAGIRGFAQKDIAWSAVAAMAIRDEHVVAVLTDGTERRTRFPAAYAERLARMGGKPLR